MQPLTIHIGTNQWNLPEWKGIVFANHASVPQMMAGYGRIFDTLEVNATYHKLFRYEQLYKWQLGVANDKFTFCPKFHFGITNRGDLSKKMAATQLFFNSISAFGERLGPCILSFNETFHAGRLAELIDYLELIKKHPSLFVDLKSETWFNTSKMDHLCDFLKKTGIGIVRSNVQIGTHKASVPAFEEKVFFRFKGVNGDFFANKHSLLEWLLTLRKWHTSGLKEVWIIIDIENVKEIIPLQKELKLALKMPIVA